MARQKIICRTILSWIMAHDQHSNTILQHLCVMLMPIFDSCWNAKRFLKTRGQNCCNWCLEWMLSLQMTWHFINKFTTIVTRQLPMFVFPTSRGTVECNSCLVVISLRGFWHCRIIPTFWCCFAFIVLVNICGLLSVKDLVWLFTIWQGKWFNSRNLWRHGITFRFWWWNMTSVTVCTRVINQRHAVLDIVCKLHSVSCAIMLSPSGDAAISPDTWFSILSANWTTQCSRDSTFEHFPPLTVAQVPFAIFFPRLTPVHNTMLWSQKAVTFAMTHQIINLKSSARLGITPW